MCIILVSSRADDTSGTASVNNTAPTVDTVITTASSGGSDSGNNGSTGVTISESPSTTTIYVRGQVTDLNGCEQISTASGDWQLKQYRTGASGAGAGATCTTADSNDCYNFTESEVTLSNCTVGGSDTTADYQFTATLSPYVDATDTSSVYSSDNWTSKVTVTDSSGSVATGTDVFEVAGTIALALGGSCINYGSLSLGQNSSDVTCDVTNTGNGAITVQVSGDHDMYCNGPGSANIPLANGKYSGTASLAYASKVALSTTPTTISDITITPNRTGSGYSRNVYFQLGVPSSGVGGTCSNTVSFTALHIDCFGDPDCLVGGGSSGSVVSGFTGNMAVGSDDSSNGGMYTWASSQGIIYADGSYATAAMSTTGPSRYLKLSSIGFGSVGYPNSDIPSNATIVGIKLRIKRHSTDVMFMSPSITDSVVKLVKGGSVVGSNKAKAGVWPTSGEYAEYGYGVSGDSDPLWGTTWSVADIESNNFGAVLSVVAGGLGPAIVDHMEVTVYYTTP